MSRIKRVMATLGLMTIVVTNMFADTFKDEGRVCSRLCGIEQSENSYGWYVEGGVLVQQMYYFNGFAAIQLKHLGGGSSDLSPPDTYLNYKGLNHDFSLEPGFRVALGRYFDCYRWKLSAAVEGMSTKARKCVVAASSNESYFPLYSLYTGTGSGVFEELDSYFSTNYYLLDLTLSRGTYFSKKFTFIPFGGLKFVWFDRHVRTTLVDTQETNEPMYETVDGKTFTVGPMIGFTTDFGFFKYFSVYFDGNISALFGNAWQRVASFQNLNSNGQTEGSDTFSFNLDNPTITPTVRTSLGVQYKGDIGIECIDIMCRVGFDGRFYSNQFSFFRNNDDEYRPELIYGAWGMAGLIATFGVDF